MAELNARTVVKKLWVLVFCILALPCVLAVYATSESTTHNRNYDNSGVSHMILSRGHSAKTLKEYRKLIEDGVDPNTFVSYEAVKCLGEFRYFSLIDPFDTPETSSNYFYGFCDENGNNLQYSLYVYEKPVPEGYCAAIDFDEEDVLTVPDKQDLRIGPPKSCEYWLGGTKYSYISGKLISVDIFTDTHILTISIHDVVSYDLDQNTFVARLLRESTAEQAVAELSARITLSLAWRKFCRHWLPWILVAVVSCATIGTVYLILRRKKKKKTAPAE